MIGKIIDGDTSFFRRFKISTNPYGDHVKLYKNSEVTFNTGLNVLVGCNGSGKTTLLRAVKEIVNQSNRELRKKSLPEDILVCYDNLRDGGHNAISVMDFYADVAGIASAITSSEGENITMNLMPSIREVIAKANQNENGNIYMLFDATDSGLSVDNIIDFKEVVGDLVERRFGNRCVFVIVAANEYEMARGEDCIDVATFKHIRFSDYEEYRKYVVKSRKMKDERYKKIDGANRSVNQK